MNVSHLIAKRLLERQEASFTRIIIRLAIAAVALSVTVMIITSAMVSGFKNEVTDKIIGFWGHIHITDGGISSTLEQMSPISSTNDYVHELYDIAEVTYEAPRTILGFEVDGTTTQQSSGGVAHVQSFAFLPGILSTRETFGGVILKGVGEDFDWEHMQRFLVEGVAIDHQDVNDNELILSTTIARTLKIDVGQRVQVSFIKGNDQVKRAFEVVGLYNTGLEEFDKQFAIVDLAKVQQILGWRDDQIGGYEVFLDNIDDSELITEYIYYEVLPSNLLAQGIKSKLSSIFEWLQMQDINMQVILLLMTIVAIINMTTALIILMLDRTKMIGVLRAVGSPDWTIRKVFLYQAAYIIGYGLVIGNVVGLGLAGIQRVTGLIKLDEANYYLTEAPIYFDWMTIIGINVGTFLVVLLCLVLPTYLVSRIQPVKVLAFS